MRAKIVKAEPDEDQMEGQEQVELQVTVRLFGQTAYKGKWTVEHRAAYEGYVGRDAFEYACLLEEIYWSGFRFAFFAPNLQSELS